MKLNFRFNYHLNLKPRNSEFSIGISTFLLLITLPFWSGPVQSQTPVLRIGLIADIQYCDCPAAGAREYGKSPEKLDEAVRTINREGVSLTVELGDLIDRDFASFEKVSRKLGDLRSRWVFIPGNHDFNVDDSLKKMVWKMIPPKNGYGSEVVGDIRLVYLNGLENSVIAWPEGTNGYLKGKETLERLEREKAPNAYDWNGGLGKKQLAWVKKVVNRANRAHQKLIVFGHQPIIPGEAPSLWDSESLLRVFEGYRGQVLYICGHNHAGGDHTIGNTRIVNLKGMVEQKVPTYGILSIFSERWELDGFGSQVNSAGTIVIPAKERTRSPIF